MSGTPIPAVVAFDVEPDDRSPRLGRSSWTGFERLAHAAPRMRSVLEGATDRPVRFGWYLRMDPQILRLHGRSDHVASAYSAEIRRLRQEGDVLGLHTHAWRWSEERPRWYNDEADRGWVAECIEMSFDAYEAAFGEPCGLHRFGDRWLDAPATRLLADRGVRVDLTPEPGMAGVSARARGARPTAAIPDPRRAPVGPSRPREVDPFRPARAGERSLDMHILPLTTADPTSASTLARRVVRGIRARGRPVARPLNPALAWRSPEAYWQLVRARLAQEPRPYLAIAIRTNAGLGGLRDLESIFRGVAGTDLGARLAFTDPEEAVRLLAAAPEEGGGAS